MACMQASDQAQHVVNGKYRKFIYAYSFGQLGLLCTLPKIFLNQITIVVNHCKPLERKEKLSFFQPFIKWREIYRTNGTGHVCERMWNAHKIRSDSSSSFLNYSITTIIIFRNSAKFVSNVTHTRFGSFVYRFHMHEFQIFAEFVRLNERNVSARVYNGTLYNYTTCTTYTSCCIFLINANWFVCWTSARRQNRRYVIENQ